MGDLRENVPGPPTTVQDIFLRSQDLLGTADAANTDAILTKSNLFYLKYMS